METKTNRIQGVHKNGVVQYKGIPYAKAERFQAPKIHDFNPNFEATSPSPACPQNPVPYLKEILGGDPISEMEHDENCLCLTITSPENSDVKNLPVIVWIHGGSYTSGAGDAYVYDPSEWVAQENIIVVNITYRLGLFGFLGDEKLKPANLGLLDICTALQWIQQHISKFGGAANNVTLYGQSAGGDVIANLMLLEGSEKWFRKAIIISCPFGLTRHRSKMYSAMSAEMEHHDLNGSISNILKAETAIEEAAKSHGLKSAMPFGIQYGLSGIPEESEINQTWQARAQHFEILFGTTAHETTLYIPRFKSMQKWFRLPVMGSIIQKIVVRYTTQKIYKKPGLKWAKRMQKAGAPTTIAEIQWGVKSNPFKATHAMDTVLLFGNWDIWKNAAILSGINRISFENARKEMMQTWANFSRGDQELKSIPDIISIQ